MKSNSEKTATKLYDLFNKRDWQAMGELTDPKCVVKDMTSGEEYKGPEGMKKWMQFWVSTCSDMHVDDANVVASSDTTVAIEGSAHGINDGAIQGPSGKLAPSGKKLVMEWVDLVDVKDGKITGIRCYYDTARMLSQLGIGAQTQPQAGRSNAPGTIR